MIQYDSAIKAAVSKYLPKHDWRLFKAQLIAESNLDPAAVSPVGAQGIAQFMPATWEQIRSELHYEEYATPFRSSYAIPAGAYYMATLIKRWSWPRPEMDRYCLALASYNAGFGNIVKAQKIVGGEVLYKGIMSSLNQVTGKHSLETHAYVQRILYLYSKLITGV